MTRAEAYREAVRLYDEAQETHSRRMKAVSCSAYRAVTRDLEQYHRRVLAIATFLLDREATS